MKTFSNEEKVSCYANWECSASKLAASSNSFLTRHDFSVIFWKIKSQMINIATNVQNQRLTIKFVKKYAALRLCVQYNQEQLKPNFFL